MTHLVGRNLALVGLALVLGLALTSVLGAQTMTASDETASIGDTVILTVTLDTAETIRGLSLGLTHDGDLVTLIDIAQGSALTALNDGDGPDFFEFSVDPDGGPGGYVAALMDLELDIVLPAEDDQAIATFEYTADAEGTSDIAFSDSLGSPQVFTVVVPGAESVTPTLVDGSIVVEVSSMEEFLRADCDGNGDVFPIIDALFLLQYGFTNGLVPPCLDAADADDNGAVFPIIDALYILSFGFTNGTPPPAPGATECGDDPTDDDVDCETPQDDCP